MPLLSAILALFLGLAVAPAAVGNTSITLRRAAQVAPDRAIRLDDVAVITGSQAEELAPLEIAPAGTNTVELAAVRSALDKAGVNWARLTLQGRTCLLADGPPDLPHSQASRKSAQLEAASIDSAEASPGTHAGLITARLAELFGVESGDLRLKFTNLNPAQRAFLSATPDPAARIRIQPQAAGSSPRVPVEIEIYQGDRLLQRHRLTAEVLVRREGVAAGAQIDRDRPIAASELRDDAQWLAPSADAPITRAQAEWMIAKRRIEPGTMITKDDVQSPIVIKRGDQVLVQCLSGGVAVKAKARALDNARDGEPVRLQVEGSKRAFKARASGRGTAVVDLPDSPSEGHP